MKTLAALVSPSGSILAIHEKAIIVHEYLCWLVFKQKQYDVVNDFKIEKLPKSELKKLSNYPDLYLVRCGEDWLPAGYCGKRKEIAEAEGYEYRQARDMLYKLCEMRRFGDKELKAIATVIGILQTEIDEIDDCHYDPRTLQEISELNRGFRDHVNNDD